MKAEKGKGAKISSFVWVNQNDLTNQFEPEGVAFKNNFAYFIGVVVSNS